MSQAHLLRTVIVGNAGSGKSWLAKHIAEELKAPAIDLDEVHWVGDAYGTRRDENVARSLVAEVAAKPAWVIEGIYG
jgi:adenylate kinase family enzyme